MLGIRLKPDEEILLARHAKALGRQKSVVAREWIMERLQQESVDVEMRRAAQIIADHSPIDEGASADALADDWMRALNEEDGGFDWGPKGPPV